MISKLKYLFRHYITPHKSNNYKAKILHAELMVGFIAFVLALQSFFGVLADIDPDLLGYASDISQEKVLYLVNVERAKRDLSPLAHSPNLAIAAVQKASDMFTKDYWAHVSPTGVTPWQFITSSGYDYLFAGENLAKNFNTSEEVVEAWMNSPTHRANILKPEYEEIGIAIMNGNLMGEKTTLVVQEFGKRRSSLASSSKSTKSQAEIFQADTLHKSSGLTKDLSTVEGEAKKTKKPLIWFLSNSINKTTSLIIAEFLLIILFIDSIFIWRKNTVRISGKSLAHIIFLASLIGAMGAAGIGVIL